MSYKFMNVYYIFFALLEYIKNSLILDKKNLNSNYQFPFKNVKLIYTKMMFFFYKKFSC